MPTIATPEAAAAAPGARALSAALARARRRAPRALVFMLVLCLAIAALLWAFDGGSFAVKLVYSFAIGFACFGVMEATRLLQALGVDLWRRWRGRSLDAAGFAAGWRGVLPAMVAMLAVGPLLGGAIGDALTGHRSMNLLQFGGLPARVTIALTVLGTLAAMFVLSTLERLAGARALAEAAQRQAAETRLKLLEAQLEPHMLFNTLANLRVLIASDPARAQAMLDRLIAFLRSTLGASRSASHALATEFERIADYLALMQVRMGPRLQARLDLPEPLRELAVPPLLLQPLVENAIKHGLEPKVGGGCIEVIARRDGASLCLSVHDSGVGLGPGGADRSDKTFGLQQVGERLHTLYGPRATLELQPAADGGTLARIRIPLAPPP